MVRENSRKISFSFLLLAVFLVVASVCEANDFTPVAARHDAGLVKRMMRKRSPGILDGLDPNSNSPGGTNGAGADPPINPQSPDDPPPLSSSSSSSSSSSTVSSSATDNSSSSSSSSTTSSSSSVPSSTQSSSSSSSTASTGSTSGSSSSSQSSSLSSTATSSSTTSSSTQSSSTSTATPTSTPPPAQSAPSSTFTLPSSSVPAPLSDNDPATSTTTLITTSSTPSGVVAASSASSSSSHIGRTTLVVIIAIAGSIGAIFVGWTIIRKWKLKPSSSFDDRMQPIDWQPTMADEGSPIPNHRRAGSGGSFHSGSGHHGDVGAYGGSDHGHANANLAPLPDHDFTAGPTALAPVGGYADLKRGPSPQPMMQEALVRGPSLTRGNYDAYGGVGVGVPLHHQGGYDAYDYNNYGNSGAGHY